MSTRTTGKRETLGERCAKRSQKWTSRGKPTFVDDHIRAELDRLARQMGKIDRYKITSYQTIPGMMGSNDGEWVKLNDVLARIKSAKR